MSEISVFESRIGKVECSDETFFSFVTDLRSLRTFIPEGAAKSILIEKESCTLNVNNLGQLNLRISGKVPNEKVIYTGNALQMNNIQIDVTVLKHFSTSTEVQIKLSADLNPFLKMIAAEPIKRVLETIVTEMEKFKGWKEVTEHNQFL